MAIPICLSSEEQRSSKASGFPAPLRIQCHAPSHCGSAKAAGLATAQSPISRDASSSDDDFQSFPPSPDRKADTSPSSVLRSEESGDFRDAHASIDGSATSPGASAMRGRRRNRRCASAGSTIHAPRSPTSPDRFIPARESFDCPATPFRVSKSPRHLSPEEKLLRRRDPSADPFMPTRSRRAASVPRLGSQHERRLTRYLPHLVSDSAIAGSRDPIEASDLLRQVSAGAVWNVGGSSAAMGGPPVGISDGMGGLIGSGTTAPMYVANFLEKTTPAEEREKHESRLALALDIDQTNRLLDICRPPAHLYSKPSPSSPHYERYCPLTWKDNAWKRAEGLERSKTVAKPHQRAVPSTPFRVLDAPLLRDDFYCSTLAYSYTSGILAVGLSSRVYLWSEALGVQYPPFAAQPEANYVTSLSFSSEAGRKSILAVGRQAGHISLWSTFDSDVRFEIKQPNAVSCVSFKQTPSRRQSERFPDTEVEVEDLAVGDDLGNVWYYSVEWPDNPTRAAHNWNGAMTLLARINAHTQQICGLAWSPDGAYLATGGNDNACLLFELREILTPDRVASVSPKSPTAPSRLRLPHALQPQSVLSRFAAHTHLNRLFDRHYRLSNLLPSWAPSHITSISASAMSNSGSVISGHGRTVLIPSNRQKHRLAHSAAVKAIAFAPWQPSLLATGGGSNDRSIHFYHTPSGARLATINVHAQVTSLIWSKTRREIAATFGYAQPEHPFRIAVFAWPSCEQVVAIPWSANGGSGGGPGSENDCGRALWAISYPGGPNESIPSAKREQTGDTDSSSSTTATPATTAAREASSGLSTPVRAESNDISRSTVGNTNSPNREREGGTWWSRTAEEGCIIVASSDESVKFHEVWSGARKSVAGASGLLGGSDILEGLEGIEKEGNEIIR